MYTLVLMSTPVWRCWCIVAWECFCIPAALVALEHCYIAALGHCCTAAWEHWCTAVWAHWSIADEERWYIVVWELAWEPAGTVGEVYCCKPHLQLVLEHLCNLVGVPGHLKQW